MNAAAIILAAGASSRLGQPKQLVRINNETLIDRAVRVTRDAGITSIIVVLGANAAEIRSEAELADVQVVINSDWQNGLASSIETGLNALTPEAEAAILIPCDQPAISAAHLKALLAALPEHTIAASTYAERTGTPAAFLRQHFEELKSLRGDQGARSLLTRDGVATIPLPNGDFDIDTPADFLRIQDVQD